MIDRGITNQWSKYRSSFLLVGFMISLAFTNLCFLVESVTKEYEPAFEILPDDAFTTIPNTVQEKKVKLPPPPKEELVIKKNEILDEIRLVDKEEVPDDKVELKDESITDDTQVFADEPVLVPMDPPIIEPEIFNEIEEEKTWDFVERMPLFGDCLVNETDYLTQKSCSDKSVIEYLYKHIHYPVIARENRVEGTVVAAFVIDKTGKVRGFEILRDIGAGCGDEVLKVLKSLPDWKPGKQNGRPVNVKIKLPVKFRLQ